MSWPPKFAGGSWRSSRWGALRLQTPSWRSRGCCCHSRHGTLKGVGNRAGVYMLSTELGLRAPLRAVQGVGSEA